MSRPTRDGTAEPVSRDQILRHARGQGNIIFSVQLTTSRIGNLTRLIHTLLYVMTIHTYIHTSLLWGGRPRGIRRTPATDTPCRGLKLDAGTLYTCTSLFRHFESVRLRACIYPRFRTAAIGDRGGMNCLEMCDTLETTSNLQFLDLSPNFFQPSISSSGNKKKTV